MSILLLTGVIPDELAAQASLAVSTGELRIPGQGSIGTVTLAPEATAATLGMRIRSTGQFSIGGIGVTRAAFESVVSTRASSAFGLAPLITLRAQDDPIGAAELNRRVDGAIGVRIGGAQLGATALVGRAQSIHAGASRTVQTSSASVHVARAGVQLRVAYSGNAFDAIGQMSAAQNGTAPLRTRLSDLTSEGTWTFRRLELGGFVGRRVGAHATGWGGASASIAITDRLGLIARQATTPADPTRHLAAQRVTTIGFRFRPSVSRAQFDDGSDAGRFRREFVLTRIDSLTHGIRVYDPDATNLEIAGSFNDWTPTTMRRTGGGWWELLVPMAAGIHYLNVRADGGKWTVPSGVQTAADEFNGTVGVLLVP